MTLYDERKTEIANGPDVCLVQPILSMDNKDPLYAVQLPQDIEMFVLIDDPEGFDVMFKYHGLWCSTSRCWKQTKDIEKDPAEYHYVNVVTFGRKILRRHKVKEMTWKEWQKRK